jgi:hypothetical protein
VVWSVVEVVAPVDSVLPPLSPQAAKMTTRTGIKGHVRWTM